MPRAVDQASRLKQWIEWCGLACGCLLAWVGLAAGASEAASDSHDQQGHVGSTVCRACHAEQFEAWSGSHHDLAMQPADASTVLGDFNDRVFEQSGMRMRFYRKGERFLVETQDAKGRDREYEISYTFGVTPLQQYLVVLQDGRYQALTVAWDTRPEGQGGQRWFSLYPDEQTPPGDELHWLAPAHNWNHACAECHSTNLRKNYDPTTDRFDTTWSEIDVGCEACHGPGGRHVELARAAQESEGADYPADHGLVVQLDSAAWELPPGSRVAVRGPQAAGASQVELCGRCHARRTQLTEDYRHGAPLSDSHRVELLEQGLYFPDGQILDEVYVYGSFRQSRMHAAGVTCSDCHEPHTLELRREGNALCGGCHSAQVYDTPKHHFHEKEGAGGSCVACHAPERNYMVVDPRRDHSFRVPRPELAVRYGVPDVCTGCHKVRTPAWAEARLQEWYGSRQKGDSRHYSATLAGGHAGSVASLTALAGDQAAPAIVRATALQGLGGQLGPASIQLLVNGLYAEDALERRAAVEALAGLDRNTRWQLLAPLLDDAVRGVRIAVAVALADVPMESLDEAGRRQLQQAFGEYLAAERLNADRVEHWVNVAGFHMRRGELDAAEASYRAALQRNPRYSPAYVNQADMYRALGREEDAEKVLRSGIAVLPDDGSLHQALGLLLIRTGRVDEALLELRTAYELDRQNPFFGYVYGVALDSTGAAGRAVNVWRDVLAQHPNDRDTLQALAVGLYRQGEHGQARVIAERLSLVLPGNPPVVQLMAAIKAAAGGATQ